MTAAPQLHRLSEARLDGLIAELRRQETKELVLLGPVEGLAERLVPLTQLTSLNLRGNKIGDAGAAGLVALTQLTSTASNPARWWGRSGSKCST